MRIAYVASGAAGMICGTCLHDNTLAAALLRLGHEVTLIPTYTRPRTDEPGVAVPRLFYNAIMVYLEQKSPLVRRLPRPFDRALDRVSARLLGPVAGLAASTDARDLGALTLSVLRGEEGHQARELGKLAAWLRDEVRPEVVHLNNSMFVGFARRLKADLAVPVVCTLQGEDLFLGQLPDPWRAAVAGELRARAADVDAFIAPNRYYAAFMARTYGIPEERVRVVPLGLHLAGHGETHDNRDGAGRDDGALVIGYLARICPEKGLDLLLEAVRRLALERPGRVRLRIAGYLARRDRRWFAALLRRARNWGLEDLVETVGEVDREEKLRFLRSLDVLSVPATYADPKGLYVLEALANGVPVVQPRHGAFPELLAATGGGVLFEPGSAAALAAGLRALLDDPARRRELGERGRAVVFADFHDGAEAAATLEVYREVLASAAPLPRPLQSAHAG